MAGQMEILTREELEEAVLKRKPGERISFREREFEPMDLTGWDLSNMDFTLSSFQNVILNQVNFSGSSVEMHCLTDALCMELIFRMRI